MHRTKKVKTLEAETALEIEKLTNDTVAELEKQRFNVLAIKCMPHMQAALGWWATSIYA